jgi:hypothetical protein
VLGGILLRKTIRVGAVLVLVILAACDAWFLSRFAARATVEYGMFDDAYYYLGVAWNIAHGHGSKFREPLSTNGYQPLWLMLLAALGFCFQLTKRGLVVACVALTGLTQALVAAVAFARRDPKYFFLGIGYVIALFQFEGVFSFGVETVLLSIVILVLPEIDFATLRSPARAVGLGLLFYLFFLIRLDALSLCFACLLLYVWKGGAIDRFVVMAVAVVTLGVGAYCLFNYFEFGVALPISGLAKALGNRPGENLASGMSFVLAAKWTILLLIASAVLLRLKREEGIRRMFGRETAVLGICSIVVALYYSVFSGWAPWPWYCWPIALLYAFVAADFLQMVCSLKRGSIRFGSAALVAAGIVMIAIPLWQGGSRTLLSRYSKIHAALRGASEPGRHSGVQNVALIEDFFNRAAPGTVVMGDRSASLGYYLPETYDFIHLEGLVADREFLNARRAGHAIDYLKSKGARYYVVDRDALLEFPQPDGKRLDALPEPIQGLSVHQGVYLLCFPADAVLYSQDDGKVVRRVYDFSRLAACPAEANRSVARLTGEFGALRRSALPVEYSLRGLSMRLARIP